MINAANTPGTHPHKVNNVVIMIDPQPLSMTASGGSNMDKMTLKILIGFRVYPNNKDFRIESFMTSTNDYEKSTEVINCVFLVENSISIKGFR